METETIPAQAQDETVHASNEAQGLRPLRQILQIQKAGYSSPLTYKCGDILRQRNIVNTKDIRNPIIVAQFRGEKVIRDEDGNYYYIAPNQPRQAPLEEKAILLPFGVGLKIQAKIQRKADVQLEKNIDEIPHKIVYSSPILKIIEGVGGRYDGAYFYVLPNGKCKVISEEFAKKMIRDAKRWEKQSGF